MPGEVYVQYGTGRAVRDADGVWYHCGPEANRRALTRLIMELREMYGPQVEMRIDGRPWRPSAADLAEYEAARAAWLQAHTPPEPRSQDDCPESAACGEDEKHTAGRDGAFSVTISRKKGQHG